MTLNLGRRRRARPRKHSEGSPSPKIERGPSLWTPQFRAVILMTLLIMIGFGLIVPGLPRFVKQFGRGYDGVGLVNFAFAATRLLGDVFAGAWIDRFGDRAMTALGAGIVGVSSIAAGAAGSFNQLLILRSAGGIGSALFLGGLMAYVIGTTAPEQRGRAMGVFQAAFGIGLFVGPAIGGAMLGFASPNVPLYLYGAVCIACIPLCLRALTSDTVASEALAHAPELGEHAAPAPRFSFGRTIGPLLRDSAYRAALGASALIFLIGTAEFTLIPNFWIDSLHQSKKSAGIPFLVSAALSLLVVWHAGGLTDRRGRKFALVPALGVLAFGIAAMGYSNSGFVFLALMAVTGASSGYTRPGPSAIVGDVASPESRGAAVAGYRIAGDIGALIGALMAGFIGQFVSPKAAFLAIGGFGAFVFLLALLARETAPDFVSERR